MSPNARRYRPLVLALGLASAAIAVSSLAADANVMRKAGLWSTAITTGMGGGAHITRQVCVGPGEDTAKMVTEGQAAQRQAGMQCTSPKIGSSAGGMTYAMSCQMQGGMTMDTSGVVKGGADTYHIETVTKMTPAPIPQLASISTTIDGKYMGPCPAGMKPGDSK